MKALIIGTSLSGKTTLIHYLRDKTKFPLIEIDEELMRINNSVYPINVEFKHKTLVPQIVKDILTRNNVVFFTNTDYFTPKDLKIARKNGFRIIQLSLDLIELQKRNKFRMENEGYPDVSQWLQGMISYQELVRSKGLVDKIIDGTQLTENIARELIEFITV